MTERVSKETIREALIADFETGELRWRHRPLRHFSSFQSYASCNGIFSGKVAGGKSMRDGRLQTKVDGKLFQNSRIIWLLHYGDWPKDQLDHINGDCRDNRISNLREVGYLENSRNRRVPKNNKSGVMGVSWHKCSRVWAARIRDGKKQIHLGDFHKFEDAVAARKAAEIEYGYHPNHGRKVA